MTTKSCGTCAHAKFSYSATGRIKRTVAGVCTYKVEMPVLPACFHEISDPVLFHLDRARKRIWPNDGNYCKVWLKPLEPRDMF